VAETAARSGLDRLLRPKSIAIVGAAPEPHTIGGGVLANLERWGFPGAIHLVSRSRAEIRGRPCVKTIDELPEGIDLVVLIVPQAVAEESVRACGRRGAGAAIVFASGFAEAGGEGRAAQEALAAVAREAGVALAGPNCIGYTNYVDRIPLTFEPVEPLASPARGAGIIAQSGAMGGNLRFALQGRGLPVAHLISTGNEASLGIEDFFEFLIADDAVSTIGIFAEQIRDPARFLAAVRAARGRAKPVVLLHPGSSARAQQSAQSHTGALAGDHAVMRTLVADAGVAVVDTLDTLFDVTALLMSFPNPSAGGVGIITNSGAFRGFAFDVCERIGLDLPRLGAPTEATLRALVPEYIPVDNPLDVGTLGFAKPEIFGQAAQAMLADPAIGFVLASLMPGGPKQQVDKITSLAPAIEGSDKPVVLNILGDDYPLVAEFSERVRASGVPLFRSADRALQAMARIDAYARTLARPPEPAAGPGAAVALPARGTIVEHLGKRVLADLGIPVPAGALARSADEAAAAAARIGYPVVLKAQAAALAHKSDAGGVIVGLGDAAAVRAGWDRMAGDIARAKPGLVLDGVLVEAMAPAGLEMVVGARRDPQWGPVVLVGLGGVWIEALGDVVLLPATVDHARAVAAIRGLKGAKLLDAFRGAPARDVDAVAAVVVTIGALMRSTPDLVEIDVNPLVVYPRGEGVLALDALLVGRE
jgi:acyl-CoA synthetase (NDP forming)